MLGRSVLPLSNFWQYRSKYNFLKSTSGWIESIPGIFLGVSCFVFCFCSFIVFFVCLLLVFCCCCCCYCFFAFFSGKAYISEAIVVIKILSNLLCLICFAKANCLWKVYIWFSKEISFESVYWTMFYEQGWKDPEIGLW